MRYSRGNRGGKSRQWGERDHTPQARTRSVRLVRCTGTTTLVASDPYFMGEPERLRFDALCSNCGARYHTGLASALPACVLCDLPIARAQH